MRRYLSQFALAAVLGSAACLWVGCGDDNGGGTGETDDSGTDSGTEELETGAADSAHDGAADAGNFHDAKADSAAFDAAYVDARFDGNDARADAGAVDTGSDSAVDANTPDAGDSAADSGLQDTSAPDAGYDSSAVDSSVPADTSVAADTSVVGDSAVVVVVDTGVVDTGMIDSTVPDTGVPDTGSPDATIPDTSVADSTVGDTSVAPDAEAPDTSSADASGIVTADAEAEEATTADGSFTGEDGATFVGLLAEIQRYNAEAGAPSQTELDFALKDISNGDAGPGQYPCLDCLFQNDCLNNAQDVVSGKECEDVTGVALSGNKANTSRSTLCLETLACIFSTSPTCAVGGDPSVCYCGVENPGTKCQSVAQGTGTCAQVEADGLELPITDPVNINKQYTNTARGAGQSSAIIACAQNNACTGCYQ